MLIKYNQDLERKNSIAEIKINMFYHILGKKIRFALVVKKYLEMLLTWFGVIIFLCLLLVEK